ncbi:DUF6049 family protein [Schumannella sp. 10F1B-5-1]|uniref:DUF6049 family protein n=1 Tax=Schumannella sp. 10F1B-5-1 TaxID=2590780 RepID=UPI001131334F|nr:DUF6049 family protein [Schumannella sp. 10F1B-5-1]TPW76786.1 hypothetical protein FJ658_02270 [Schumannella sp. 10F1B-5-1]
MPLTRPRRAEITTTDPARLRGPRSVVGRTARLTIRRAARAASHSAAVLGAAALLIGSGFALQSAPASAADATPGGESDATAQSIRGPDTAVGVDGRVAVATILPLTVPTGYDGLIPSDDLADLTADDGLLTRELDAVAGRPVALGIDPRLIASIRVLGGAAPASARAWLTRLQGVSNETFALRYADADPVGPGQAGAAASLAPLGFDFAIDDSRFGDPLPAASPSATPSGTASGTPSSGTSSTPGSSGGTGNGSGSGASGPPSDDASGGASTSPSDPPSTPSGALPPLPTTVDEVLAWEYSLPTIAWPAENTVVAADLPRLQAAGDEAVLLGDENVSTPDATHLSFDGLQIAGLTIDTGLSAAVRAAATTDQSDYSVVDQEVQSAAAAGGSAVRVVALGRPSGTADQTVDALDAALTHLFAVANAVPLSTALGETAEPSGVVDHPEDATRLAAISALLTAEQQETRFAVVAADGPLAITAPRRLDLLSTLSTGWVASRSWAGAVSDFQTASAKLLDGVQLTQGSDLVALGASAPLPMTVQNSLDVPIVVYARARPLSPVLSIDSGDQPIKVEVPAGATETVRIPAQAITNGSVQVVLSLTATDGSSVGQQRRIHVEVQAGWETVGTAVVAIGAIGVFGFGIVRNILKRRRRLAGEVDEEDAANAPLPGQEDGPADVDARAAAEGSASGSPVDARHHDDEGLAGGADARDPKAQD